MIPPSKPLEIRFFRSPPTWLTKKPTTLATVLIFKLLNIDVGNEFLCLIKSVSICLVRSSNWLHTSPVITPLDSSISKTNSIIKMKCD